MIKAAVVILADTETHADPARTANALTTAYDFKESGDEVTVVFTGAGTKWVGKPSDPDQRLHRTFRVVRGEVAGACKACAASFGVRKELEASGVPLLTEYGGYESLRRLVTLAIVISAPFFAEVDWERVGTGAWAVLAFSAVFATAFAFSAWQKGIFRIGANRALVY